MAERSKSQKSLRKDPRLTKGYFKLWNLFMNISKNEKFLVDVKKARKILKIPSGGYKENDNSEIKIDSDDIYPLIDKIFTKYGFFSKHYILPFIAFLYFNSLSKPFSFAGLCEMEEVKNRIIWKEYDKLFPIAIRISPHASLRDISEYVRKYSRIIKEKQEKYKEKKIKIGQVKLRNRTTQERNDFIYKNQNLPIKEISALVYKKFKQNIDHGYIGKIISLEKKSRKEL